MNAIKTIGLTMIVRNEAHVILRCLESVRPLLDFAVIVDTGSTDGTQQLVADYAQSIGLPLKVVDRPWVNFAHNRSGALAELRAEAVDFGFTIDADETLVFEDGFDIAAFKRDLSADVNDISIWNSGTIYRRPLLFTNRKPLVYKAVLHEYLEIPPGCTRAAPDGLHVLVSHDGARSQNPNKYRDDARLLAEALETETDPFLISRYTFYLAQCYRDAGERELSYATYLKRAELGYWVEETYISLLRAGQIADALERPVEERLALYLRAYEVVPTRAEALHGAAALCRQAKRYHLGYLLARTGIGLSEPHTGLFIDRSVYEYRMLDEFQVNAYWAGHYGESLDAAVTMLRERPFPESIRGRLTANAQYAMDKVEAAAQEAAARSA